MEQVEQKLAANIHACIHTCMHTYIGGGPNGIDLENFVAIMEQVEEKHAFFSKMKSFKDEWIPNAVSTHYVCMYACMYVCMYVCMNIYM
jgi:hypothetical protein